MTYRFSILCVPALLSIALPVFLSAQGNLRIHGSVSHPPFTGDGCGTNVSTDQGSIQDRCSIAQNGTLTADVYAAVDRGTLSTSASATASLASLPSDIDALAVATWTDALRWSASAATPSTVVFRAAIGGVLDAVLPAIDPYVTATAEFQYIFSGPIVQSEQFSVQAFGNQVGEVRTVAERRSFSVDLSSSLGSVPFEFTIASRAFVDVADPHFPFVAVGGAAVSNFRSTAGITGLAFYDAQGNDVTDQVSYSFDRGMQFYDPRATVTPEPVSMALLGTGLAGLGAVRRRRRRETV